MTNNQYCVILAGGAGSRLWPISKLSFPKQFLEVADTGKTFLQHTYERFCTIVPPENIIVVTAQRYNGFVKDQLPQLPEENILLEPYSRNTAPAVAFSTYSILKRNPEATIVVTPCDHIIYDEASFRADIISALAFASSNDVLVTLGVAPTRPDPNFGYIQVVGGRNSSSKGDPLPVKTFVEKPSEELAQVFINTGEFLWNSGMFVWKAKVIAEEIKKHMPQLADWFAGWDAALGTDQEQAFLNRTYGICEKTAIDIGVMEKTSRAWVYPAQFGWTDIGSWGSLYDYSPKDGRGNASSGKNRYIINSEGNLILSTNSNKFVAVNGLDNMMVVDTPDCLIVCPRDEKSYNNLVSGLGMPGFEKYR